MSSLIRVMLLVVACLCCSVFEAHPSLCDAVIKLIDIVSKDVHKTPASAARRMSYFFLSDGNTDNRNCRIKHK